MLNDRVITEKHKSFFGDYMHNYRKRETQEKAQENKAPQVSTSTDPTPTPVIYNYNQTNECVQKNFIGNPFSNACDMCERLCYMNELNHYKKHT
jgi:hypothetical protein